MRAAVMDLGTNSFKLLVAQGGEGGVLFIQDVQEVVRLGDGLALTGRFSDASMERALETLGDFLERCEDMQVDVVMAVGTMGFRRASNGEELLAAIRDRFGLQVRIISGEEEAELSFQACGGEGPRVVADVGGGSTELVFGDDGIRGAVSVEVGALFLTDRFLDPSRIPSKDQLDMALLEARRSVREGVAKLPGPLPPDLWGVGGTFTTLASVALGLERYDQDRVHRLSIPVQEVERQLWLYASMTGEERKTIRGMHPKRAHVALGGAVAALAVIRELGAQGVTVSARGLRHALMLRLMGDRGL